MEVIKKPFSEPLNGLSSNEGYSSPHSNHHSATTIASKPHNTLHNKNETNIDKLTNGATTMLHDNNFDSSDSDSKPVDFVYTNGVQNNEAKLEDVDMEPQNKQVEVIKVGDSDFKNMNDSIAETNLGTNSISIDDDEGINPLDSKDEQQLLNNKAIINDETNQIHIDGEIVIHEDLKNNDSKDEIERDLSIQSDDIKEIVNKKDDDLSTNKNENIQSVNKLDPELLDLSLPDKKDRLADMPRPSPIIQKAKISKSGEQKNHSPGEGMTTFSRLLHDVGLELVRQKVYEDLIEIQVCKEAEDKLGEKERTQLQKLEEAHQKLETKNKTYNVPYKHKCGCRTFASNSINALEFHREFGTLDNKNHICCFCPDFKTRNSSLFISHMSQCHIRTARIRKKMANFRCFFCPYEAKNNQKLELHMTSCARKFNPSSNLCPFTADCDIPLKQRAPAPKINPPSQFSNPPTITPPMAHSTPTRNLAERMQNMLGANKALAGVIQAAAQLRNPAPQKMIQCEICGHSVNSRASLFDHMTEGHKVNLTKSQVMQGRPTAACGTCPAKFWTYQGLARHQSTAHRRTNAPSTSGGIMPSVQTCLICNEKLTASPLNHLSSKHNVTLLDMYQARQCCLCNRSLKNGDAFQDHMILTHKDIFPNKDILHTVLRALSAARLLKRDEPDTKTLTAVNMLPSRRPTAPILNRRIPQTFSGPRMPSHAEMLQQIANQMQMNNMPRLQNQKPQKRKRPSKPQPPPPVIEKKTTEEQQKEMKKLYDDLAGIGRPILRSMKSRLSSSATTDTSVLSNNTSSAASEKSEGEEPPNKAVRLEESINST